MSVPVPLTTRIALSRNPRILAFGGNPASYVPVDGRSNKSYVLPDWEPWPDLGLDGQGFESLAN